MARPRHVHTIEAVGIAQACRVEACRVIHDATPGHCSGQRPKVGDIATNCLGPGVRDGLGSPFGSNQRPNRSAIGHQPAQDAATDEA
jgi:hypothetical protein